MSEFFDGREMVMVHRMFRRELGLAAGLVRATGQDRADVIADHILSVTTTLHHHHHMEDEFVWPLLLQRCPGELASAVELMESQHEQVAKFGDEVNEALAAWRSEVTPDSREALVAALERMVPALLEHLNAEEERVVPLMEKHIGLAEWNALVAKGIAEIPPEQMVVGFGMVMYEGFDDLIDATIANMPAEVQPVMRDLATQAFAAHAQLIHGTATPTRSTELSLA